MNDQARALLERHFKSLLFIDGALCQQLAKSNISVDEGWPEIMRLHCGMLVSAYAASLTIRGGNPRDPSTFDRFDWDKFMKMVEDMCKQQLVVLKDEVERQYGQNNTR